MGSITDLRKSCFESTPKNLQDFIKSEMFSKKLAVISDKTIGEIFLMILKFSITYSLPMSATTNLFKLINTIFESPILPESNHIIDKILSPKGGVEFHAVCPNCSTYVGELAVALLVTECVICKTNLNLKNPSDPNFFVLINPSQQISDLITVYDDHYDFVTRERNHENNYVEDVYDGKLYRKCIQSMPDYDRHNYVTACFNTDGAPKFKSSKCSVWPIYLQINELPAQDRLNNLITCGLWFNKKKPEMTVFIREFVRLINNVRNDGIPCFVKGSKKNLKLYVVSCCADAVARAPIQGFKQFNAYYGCNVCLHPGKFTEGSMKYNNLIPLPPLRTHEDT